VVAAVGPDWLGSPQHFAAGAVLAFVIMLVASRWKAPWWLAAVVAVGVTCAAEIALKFAEYLAVHLTNGSISSGAYYDSLVDNTTTLVGALVGAALGVVVSERLRRNGGAR
jgi:hypothetical protein